MIIDTIENFELYPFGAAWKRAFTFLKGLTPASEEKKYLIEGEELFAIVMSYETRFPESGLFEAHRDYVDIQTVIVGGEGFECSFVEGLEIETPYDASAEAAFFKRERPGETRVDVYPGTFVMLYPGDAHLPGLIIGAEAAMVKKVVVKIKKELLLSTDG